MAEPTVEEKVRILKERAEADKSYERRCPLCRQPPVFVEHDHAVAEGHVYSEAGKREVANTDICEWCFDKATLPEDEL